MSKPAGQDPILKQKFDELTRKNEESLLGGGEKRIEQQQGCHRPAGQRKREELGEESCHG